MKLSKNKLNKILYEISEDNSKYGLIFKLTYIYARKIGEVLSLRVSDIDLKHNSIDFNIPKGCIGFVLDKHIKKELLAYIEENHLTGEDFIFINDEDFNINYISKKLNNYLYKYIHTINKKGYNLPIIVCTDLRVLRGQHLFCDGVSLKLIHELYGNSYIHSTKRLIDYDLLMSLKFPCKWMDNIFSDFTDLNVYSDDNFNIVDVYCVQSIRDDDTVVVAVDSDGLVYVTGSEELYQRLKENNDFVGFIVDCGLRLSVGEYSLFDGFKVLKN